MKNDLEEKQDDCNADVNTDSSTENSKMSSENASSIVDEIRQAAELATINLGFIYDERMGLYYDSNTGYYYNAEYGLYYDFKTGTYMSYNEETATYEFHSKVDPIYTTNINNEDCNIVTTKRRKDEDDSKVNKKAIKLRKTGDADDESQDNETLNRSPDTREDGECSDTNSSDFSEANNNNNSDNENNSDYENEWPPCMRIIVEQSGNPKIKIGSLHILTYEGGTIGREGDTNAVLLPDRNISKVHLKLSFNEDIKCFMVVDLGSKNGTILNGNRISVSKQESEPHKVEHGSRIKLGSLVLLCHIHKGNQTCGLCEPGLIQQNEPVNQPVIGLTKDKLHKHELKLLRKKFGINPYDEEETKLGKGYTDRALQRRKTVGSQNPYEKTETASLEKSISSENKGFKMLAKMGWKEGESLGKDNQGLIEPISLTSVPGPSGLKTTSKNTEAERKKLVWTKTVDRFQKLPQTVNDLFNSEDSE